MIAAMADPWENSNGVCADLLFPPLGGEESEQAFDLFQSDPAGVSNVLNLTRCAVVLSLLAGCGGGADRPATQPVKGRVVYKGLPVAEANVTFSPASGRPATGTTDAQGEFTLTTFIAGDGAIEGEHQVLVEKYGPAAPNDPYAERKSLLPEKYGVLKTTPLKQTIGAGGNTAIAIELAD